MSLLGALVKTSAGVSAASSRNAKIRSLADCLRSLDRSEIEIAVRYLSGETPQGRTGIGYSAIEPALDAPAAHVDTLTITDVDQQLTAVAAVRGAGAAARRVALLRELFARATVAEREFLARLLVGELRQGALAGVMLDAIAAASGVPVVNVRRASMYAGNLGAVARTALVDGAEALGRFQLEILVPVAPMLAQTAADVAEALQQLSGDVAFEWKMDGARIQVHRSADTIRIYTRTLKDVTESVPDIVEKIRQLPIDDLVLDGEAIALTDAGRPHAFQVTMRRFGRKLDIEQSRAKLPLHAFFFDCLRSGGRSLVDRPGHERYVELARAVPDLMRMPRLVTRSTEAAVEFQDQALSAGHEGVMAKALDAPYEAGNRGASWLKIKRAHTLDLVVLAAEWGHGRRTGRLSNLHLGAFDEATGEYVMLGKTFKGLTDAMLEWQTREFLAREVRRDAWTVFVRPELVVEIAFSDLQASTRYPGGLALRLARVKRYRDDKRPDEADTMASVRRIFASQQ
jgi:ATP-dependent DNA ligase I